MSIFDPGTAQKVGDTKGAVNATLAGGSNFWGAGNLNLTDPNSLGGQYLQQAATAAATPVTYNTVPMDQDAAKQAAIGQIYAGLYANGGYAEAAAKQAGNADISDLSQGGAAGALNAIHNSRAVMGNTSQIGTQERAQNGGASNASDFQIAQLNLAKATMAAQASHAQHVNAMNAQAVQNYLGNQQIGNNQNLYDAASNARAGEAQINQQVSNTNWNAALTAGGAALASGGAIGSQAINAYQTGSTPSNSLLGNQIDQANSLTLTSPSTQFKLATTGSNPFSPGTLQNSYPVASNAWAIPSSAALIP